jgi:hypothetical protein
MIKNLILRVAIVVMVAKVGTKSTVHVGDKIAEKLKHHV